MNLITRRFVLGTATAMAALPVWAQSEAEATDGEMVIEDVVLGNPESDVEVIEYASFTCPHCRTFHEGPFKQLQADYIDTGKIKFVYREFFFDREGLWAAMLARCAGNDKYMGVADMIYTQQGQWPDRQNPSVTATNLKKIGLIAGLEPAAIDACLADEDLLNGLVAKFQKQAGDDGVTSTPSFVINGTTHRNMNYDEMVELIEKELGN